MPTIRIKPAPVVLILGASAAFIRRCHDVTTKAQAVVVETDISSFSKVASQTRARAVVMPEAIFNTNAELFTTLAADAGTTIVTVPGETIAQPELERRLLAVLDASDKSSPA
jgi:hypothetical protein